MNYMEYFAQHDTENFSWCKPYTNRDETHYIIMHDGEPLSIKTPNIEAWRYDGSLTDEIIKQVAREINPDYKLYHGWRDLHIALDSMHEIGCHYCPFKEDCEAMGEEMQETDYR